MHAFCVYLESGSLKTIDLNIAMVHLLTHASNGNMHLSRRCENPKTHYYYYFQLKTTLNECSRRSGADIEGMMKISESTRSHNTNNNQPKVMRYFLFHLFLSFWLPYMCTFIWYLSSANSTVDPNALLIVSFT